MKNACIAFGIQGTILGLALGLAGGLARGSARSAGAAALVGLALGGLAGVGSSLVLVSICGATKPVALSNDNILLGLVVHVGIWATTGAAGGLALGLGFGGRGRVIRGLLGGLVGALIATVLFDVAGAVVAPMSDLAAPLSAGSGLRLLTRLLVAVSAAAGAAAALHEKPAGLAAAPAQG